jgi:hypothetical protein
MPWQGVCPMELRMKLVNALVRGRRQRDGAVRGKRG